MKAIRVILLSLALSGLCTNADAERLKVSYVDSSTTCIPAEQSGHEDATDDETDAEAIVDVTAMTLRVKFYASYPAANINIYKGKKHIVSTINDVKSLAYFDFDLSRYGKGQYHIDIVVHEEEDLKCDFEI